MRISRPPARVDGIRRLPTSISSGDRRSQCPPPPRQAQPVSLQRQRHRRSRFAAFSRGRLRPPNPNRPAPHARAPAPRLAPKARQRIFPSRPVRQQLARRAPDARRMHGCFQLPVDGRVPGRPGSSPPPPSSARRRNQPQTFRQRLAQTRHAAVGIQRRLVDSQQNALRLPNRRLVRANIQS